MKKLILALGLGGSMAFFAGCSTSGMAPGLLYYRQYAHLALQLQQVLSLKKALELAANILGLIAVGDCSIHNAASKAGDNQIKSVDSKNFGVLGLYSTSTTIVKGN